MKPHRERSEAIIADPTVGLPRQPVPLHRGGYPDGA